MRCTGLLHRAGFCALLRSPASFIALIALALPGGQATGQGYSEELYDALEWSNIGPARGGRSIGAAGSAARPFEYFFGATGGGLWKTTDGGTTWSNVTDGQISSSSVGAVQVCEANPDVVYIGMGETELRGNVQQGDGIYRSNDAGETWSHIGLAETQNIARVRIHPTDCNTVWVAAFGRHASPNPERGVFKTTNGGGPAADAAAPIVRRAPAPRKPDRDASRRET